MLSAYPQIACDVYRKEGKMFDYITPVDVVRRDYGSMYVITADEIALINALGVSNKVYANML